MNALDWIVWLIFAAGYATVLGITSRAERRFMEDPHRRVPLGGTIVVRTPSPAVSQEPAVVAFPEVARRSAVAPARATGSAGGGL